jgi:hypothetical protein
MNPAEIYFQDLTFWSRASPVGVTHEAGACPGADVAATWPESCQADWRDSVAPTAMA